MKKHDFWDSWKNLTLTEKNSIIVAKKARALIIKAVPRKALVSIYIKGSFARREMKPGSDIDIVPIVTENRHEKAAFSVNSKKLLPAMVVPLSLWELKNNKLFTKSSQPRARPDRFVKMLPQFKLIHGRALNPHDFPVRDDKTMLLDHLKGLKRSIMPLYEKEKLDFSIIVKSVFWLTQLEQEIRGKKVNHSFKDIARSVKEKNHIVHDAMKLRLHPAKDEKVRTSFIAKLKKHIARCERIIR